MSSQIQQHITILYDLITENTERDFEEIRYWLKSTPVGQNEMFAGFADQLAMQIRIIRKDLNKLSESTEDLQIILRQCKTLILLEQRKDEDLKKYETKV
jgi:hypothetical protein